MNRILKAPELVSWEITNQCNLRCDYCSNDDNFYNSSLPLSTEECKKIIDNLHKAEVFRINIEGGEPFLRNDLLEIIGYLNEKGYIPKIATNGTLITRELAKELANYKISTLQISLDAPNKECYSNIRGSKIYFDKILENIEYLKEFKIPICLSMVLLKTNINLVEDFIIFAKKIKVNSVRFIDFIPNSEEKMLLVPSSEEIKKAYITINKFENTSEFKIIKPYKLLSTLIFDQKNEKTIRTLLYFDGLTGKKRLYVKRQIL
ncbi:radical SAM protein [Anaerocellum danielii]|uniref:Radical SAM protein n=1 Tax=Anaerocellum danielii TaxID=1387557 RepID=A0ABZ0U152_9FIRM|nr:radical SAM protein [Caldicellulosiruptor danielii]WPX07905.1 radical SAM protein [Caldicellulosiruptor danielii]